MGRTWPTVAPMQKKFHQNPFNRSGETSGPRQTKILIISHLDIISTNFKITDKQLNMIYLYRWDACSRTWSTVAPMLGARSGFGVAAMGGRLYAVGGRDGGACLRSVECYNPTTNHWSACAPMTRRRGGVSVSIT